MLYTFEEHVSEPHCPDSSYYTFELEDLAAFMPVTGFTVPLTGAQYLRILPTEDDVKPGGRLAPTFTLTREARAMLRDALAQLAQTLPGGKSAPGWEAKSHEVRSRIYASACPESEHNVTDGAKTEEEEEDKEDIVHAGDVGHESLAVPDDMVNDIPPPAKWVRLTLDLPGITFTPLPRSLTRRLQQLPSIKRLKDNSPTGS
ncbi:hypothetical protein ACOZB2_27575 [Pantoea endophytica]